MTGMFSNVRSGNPAVELLRYEFQLIMTNNLSLENIVSVAHYLAEIGQFEEAGEWYEVAGTMCISSNTLPLLYRAFSANTFYTRALECFSLSNDAASVERVSSILIELSKLCMDS